MFTGDMTETWHIPGTYKATSTSRPMYMPRKGRKCPQFFTSDWLWTTSSWDRVENWCLQDDAPIHTQRLGKQQTSWGKPWKKTPRHHWLPSELTKQYNGTRQGQAQFYRICLSKKKSIKKPTVATTTTDTAGKESTFLDWPRSSLLDQVCCTKIKMCSHAKIQENNTHAQEQKQSTDNGI